MEDQSGTSAGIFMYRPYSYPATSCTPHAAKLEDKAGPVEENNGDGESLATLLGSGSIFA